MLFFPGTLLVVAARFRKTRSRSHRPSRAVVSFWGRAVVSCVKESRERGNATGHHLAWTVMLACLAARSALACLPEAYEQKWRTDAISRRIDTNIERFRKGDAAIEVVDASGRPVAGAQVEAMQVRHEFLFGCNAFVLGQFKTADENRRYEEAFARLFNFATVPLYWAGTEPTPGELRYAEGCRDMWRRPPVDRFIPWAARQGITLKGHPLLWHAHNPSWLPKDADSLRSLYRKRFREIAERYGDRIRIFDVVNESLVCDKGFALYSPDRAYVAWAFTEAAKVFPGRCCLMINEVTEYNFFPAEKNPYVAQVRALLAQGARVQGIGLQYHYFRRSALDAHLSNPRCDPNRMLDLYEKMAELRVPLYITEITIPSAGDDGERLQAEVVRDHYRLWFSAPTMAGITWWNLGDGTAVQGENEAQGGLLDSALRPKAAYRVLEELIHRQWTTRARLQTDAAGIARFRGFFGKYRVTATHDGQSRSWEIDHAGVGPKTHRLTW